MENKIRKIALCVPMSWSFIPVEFFMSFMGMVHREQNRSEIQIVIDRSCYLDQCRNNGITNALTYNPDYILCLDADQVYPDNTIEKLCDDIDAGHEIVGGFTHSRANGEPLVYIYNSVFKGMAQQKEKMMPKKGLFACTAMGMGGIMFNPKVFKKVTFPWFRTGYTEPEEGKAIDKQNYIGEDIYFFKRCADAGIKAYVDIDLKFGHLKTKPI